MDIERQVRFFYQDDDESSYDVGRELKAYFEVTQDVFKNKSDVTQESVIEHVRYVMNDRVHEKSSEEKEALRILLEMVKHKYS